jgi:hypothetical protein
MQLVIAEGHLSDTVFVSLQILKTLLSGNIPNSDRTLIRSRKQPLTLDGAILLIGYICGHG